ncbi:MAG TPA: long-chain fatty acid--CoA ligase [Methylomirabilota bacterium]|nr:long-chain fatty acid--CoA ligase [Methylomirabilota bacterium]
MREGEAPRYPPPPVVFKGRLWSAEEMASIAAGWLDIVRERTPARPGLTAMLMANHPEAIALFFALSSLPHPVIVYAADPRAWRSQPPVPPGTPLFVPPPLREMADAGDALGLRATVLPEARAASAPTAVVPFMSCRGFVNFTSGSTGLPKPAHITTRSFLVQTAAIIEACGLTAETNVAGSLFLYTHYGLGQALILPTVLGSTLGLLERFDARSLLTLWASGAYGYWAGTPMMADMLTRVPMAVPRSAIPRICHISAGKLTRRVFDAFTERFGVKLRPNYGQTENGFITADRAPDDAIRPDCVGRASPGIEIRVGEDPRVPDPPGTLGRVWYRSPWYMEGYGFPPDLAPREGVQGWWPTADMGVLDADGYLTLAGRVDDCFKTSAGHLVNPGEIVQALMSRTGVIEIVVVPVLGPAGHVIGVVAEADETITPDQLRTVAARRLPAWLQPHVLARVARLPRLVSGKADRQACQRLLLEARGWTARAPAKG